jgi:hypothetical protein
MNPTSGLKLKGKKVDIILKPRLDLAARTLDLTKVYAGEITIKGVDVQSMNSFTTYQSTSGSSTSGDESDTAGGDKKGAEGTETKPAKKGSLWQWVMPW